MHSFSSRLPNHAGGEVLKRGKKGEREGERLAFALCSIKNYTRMPKGKYAVNSSVLGSRAEQQQGGRIEARRHERRRVKGSEARRGVQGRKRDHGNIFNNRTILSNTLYTLQEPPCSAATSRTGHATSDARTRTPQRQDACGARDYSAGRGCDGNWHGPHPRPAFAPLQPSVFSLPCFALASSVHIALWRLRTFVVRCVADGVLVTVLTVVYCNTTCLSCHI